MAFEMDTLDMDFQIDYAFGVLYSTNLAGCVDAAAIFAGEEDRDILECLHVPDPMLFVMERELFALVAWTLILTADLERGRFAAPFMNAVHCFEAKTICSLERDPRNYFEDERCTVLAPPIVKDVDTVLLCCVENDMNPLAFLGDALKDLIDFTELEKAEDAGWAQLAVRFHSLVSELEKNPEGLSGAMRELLEMNDEFFGTDFHRFKTFYPERRRGL